MDILPVTYSYGLTYSSIHKDGALVSARSSRTNPYLMHNNDYYNQRISLNILSKSIQLYNDVVRAYDTQKSITALRAGLSIDQHATLGTQNIRELLEQNGVILHKNA